MKFPLSGRPIGGAPFSSDPPDSSRLTADFRNGIHAEVWHIAWPSVLTFLLMTLNLMVDRAFVGKLGRDALAAVGVGGQLLFLLVSLSMAVSVGTTALVARFTGAQEEADSARATGQSLALAFFLGILSTIAVFLGLGYYLVGMDLTPAAYREANRFLLPALLSQPAMFLGNIFAAAFRGLGDTRTPLKVMLLANAVHVLGDFLLIFGYLGFPRMGLLGAGIALAFANLVALFAYLWLLRGTSLHRALWAPYLRLTLEWTRRILKIGFPGAVTAFLRVTSLMGFTAILSRTPERMAAVAALPIGLVAESIAFMPGLGYSVAASALVGQALGAKDPDRAERYGWYATWQGVAIMTAMGIVFFLAADPFVRVFTSDPEVHRLAVSYLRIMAFSEPFLGLGMVLTGALQGAGDTTRPAILTALTFWAVRMPLAYVLAVPLGLQTAGAWYSMAATTILGGLLCIALFKSDSWKRIRV